MRTFKIFIITVILLGGAGLVLAAIYGVLPSGLGPTEDEFNKIYKEEDGPVETDDLYSKQMKQYQGTVKVLGVSIYGEGTHRLEEDDKLVAILESEKINLPDFEGKEVKVRGFVRDTATGGQKIMTVDFIEIVGEAGVKAFSELGYEFSFSYPADWKLVKETDKVTFSREKNDLSENLIIVYQFQDVTQALEEWLKDRDQNLIFEEQQVKVGSTTGVRRTVKNGDEKIVKTYVKEGNNAYEIRLVSQDEVISNQYFSIVDFFKTGAGLNDDVQTEDEAGENEAGDPAEDGTGESEVTELSPDEDKPAEDKPVDDKPVEEATVSGTENTEGAADQSFTDLSPLSQTDISRVLEKGFSPFAGRTLTFEYPKVWYFSYLGSGKYGFTDDATYKASSEEITEKISRVLLIAGMVDVPCTESVSKSVGGTTYTVCTREPGLKEIADKIAESLKKTEE